MRHGRLPSRRAGAPAPRTLRATLAPAGRPWLAAALLAVALLALAAPPAALAQPAPPRDPPPAPPPAEVLVEGGTQVVQPPRADAPPPPPLSDPYLAGARTVIPRAVFRDTQKTVADVLEEVPGVVVTRSGDSLGATRVALRGSRSDQVLILLDGVPLSAAGDSPAQRRASGRAGLDLAALPLERVESIEVVRGAASSLYGPGAAAGAILIRTRRAPEPALAVAATTGSDGYRAGDVTWSVPLAPPGTAGNAAAGSGTEHSLTLHGNQRRSDGSYLFYDADAANGTTTIPAGSPCAVPLGGGLFRRGCNASHTATLEADWRAGPRRHVAALLERLVREGLGGTQDPRPYGREEQRRARLLYEDGHRLGTPAPGAREPASAGLASAELATAGPATVEPAGPLLSWQASAERLRSERNENTQAPDSALAAGFTDDRAGGELRGERWLQAHRLGLGAAWSREVLDDRRFRAARSTASVFAAWDYHPPRGAWEASLRHDAPSDLPGRTTARAALSQPLAGPLGLKASAATGYRPPTLFERYDPGAFGDASVANPALQPERSRSRDGGLYAWLGDALGTSLYAEALAFRQEADQQILAIPAPASPNLFRFENVNRTRNSGVEAALSLRLPAGGAGAVALDAAWTRQQALILDNDAVDARDNGHRVPGVPDEHANLSLAWRRAGWHGWLQARHRGRRFVDSANTRYLQPYTVADAGLTAPLVSGWSLALEGRNLGNVTYAEQDNFPPPGRQWFLTLRWQRGTPIAPTPPLPPTPRAASATPGAAR